MFFFSFREGWIESKIRYLISGLENTQNLKFAHPFPGPFKNHVKENDKITLHRSYFYMGLILDLPPKNSNGPKTIDLSPAVNTFIQTITDWPAKPPNSTADIKIYYLKQYENFSFPLLKKKKIQTFFFYLGNSYQILSFQMENDPNQQKRKKVKHLHLRLLLKIPRNASNQIQILMKFQQLL